MSYSIESNIDVVIKEQEAIMANFEQEMEPLVERAAEEALAQIVSDWPSRTGRSASAWRAEVDGLTAIIENTVEYSQYINQGDSADEAESTFNDRFELLALELEEASAELLEG